MNLFPCSGARLATVEDIFLCPEDLPPCCIDLIPAEFQAQSEGSLGWLAGDIDGEILAWEALGCSVQGDDPEMNLLGSLDAGESELPLLCGARWAPGGTTILAQFNTVLRRGGDLRPLDRGTIVPGERRGDLGSHRHSRSGRELPRTASCGEIRGERVAGGGGLDRGPVDVESRTRGEPLRQGDAQLASRIGVVLA